MKYTQLLLNNISKNKLINNAKIIFVKQIILKVLDTFSQLSKYFVKIKYNYSFDILFWNNILCYD